MKEDLKDSRKTRYTKAVLQDSLLELLKQKPIAKITVKELCETADINRTTFYAHYNDPYDLLYEIGDSTLEWARETIEGITKVSRDGLLTALQTIFQYFIDNNKQIRVLMSEGGDIDFQKQLVTVLYSKCGMLMQGTKEMDAQTRELYFVFNISGSLGLIQHWLKNGLNKTAKEMAELVFDLTKNML